MGIRMRRLLALTAGFTTLVLGLSACGSAGSGSDDPGTVTYAIDTDFLGLDPNTTPQAQDARAMKQIYDNLLTKDEDGKIVGWLATKWSEAKGGSEFSFTLRPGVKFHDDTDLDAQAVCDNFDRIADPDTASRYAVSLLGPYKSCHATGKLDFTVDFTRPYSVFLGYLTEPFLAIASPTAAKKYGDQFAFHPVGSGPFEFVSYTIKNKLVLKKNPDYDWAPSTADHQGPAYIDTLEFQIITDPTVRVGSLRSGNVQAIGAVPETEAGTIEDDAALTFYAKPQAGAPYTLYLNTQRDTFSDVRVRRALAHAINVPTITKALYFGVYQDATTSLNPTTEAFDKNLKRLDYDPDEANRLLDGAGWTMGADGVRTKDGKRLTIVIADNSPNREKRQDVGQFVYSYARKVGFDVQNSVIQLSEATPFIQAGKYDMAGLSLATVSPNVLMNLYGEDNIPNSKRNGFNYAKVKGLDPQLLAAQAETDQTKRDAIYSAIQKKAIDDAYGIPIYVPTYTVATRGISEMAFDAGAFPLFYDVKPAGGED